MEFRLWFFSLALTVSVCPDPERAELNPELELGGSSLTFVFDVTGSMYDDLQQVIDGASRILQSALSRADRPIRNFVLVPFHDPDIGPVSITTDPKQFHHDLQELFVQGGGDCPEMSVGAILLALEVSLPGSFIYVFTDARAKDYQRKQEVLQLVQLHQSQVVFVLTGDCGDRSKPGYRVYEEIAATSSGQIFHLDKQQVNEVLKWVEATVQAMKVHLLSSDHELSQKRLWELPFDPSLKEVTVSLSGPGPHIELGDPLGHIVGERQGLRVLLNIPNSVLVVNLKNPRPGLWRLKVECNGRHTLRVTGVSNLDFRAGFSTSPISDPSRTRERPIKGISAHALLKCSGLKPPGLLSSLVLVSKHGEDLLRFSVPLPADGGESGVWRVPQIHTPSEGFFIKVKGKDAHGFDFHRLSSVLYTNIVPGVPVVEMPAVLHGVLMQSVLIQCTAQSDLPFTLIFSKDGRQLGEQITYQSSTKASWEIGHASVEDEGVYECSAQSSAGLGRASTHFTIRVPPVVAESEAEVTAVVGESVYFPCSLVAGIPLPEINWSHNGQQVQSGAQISISSDGTLHLEHITPEHAGKYTCTAVNTAGSANRTTTLQIHMPQRIVGNEEEEVDAEEGHMVSLMCDVQTNTPSEIIWTRDGQLLDLSSDLHILPGGRVLQFSRVRKQDAGQYVCTANANVNTNGNSNANTEPSSGGLNQKSFIINIHAPPTMLPFPHSEVITPQVGSWVTLSCEVPGVPDPEVTWYRNGQKLDLKQQNLTIRPVQVSDGGFYSCEVSHLAVQIKKSFTLTVHVPPIIVESGPSDVSTPVGAELTLACRAEGTPTPQLTWMRDGVRLNNTERLHISADGSRMTLLKVRAEDSGRLHCLAVNAAGAQSKSYSLFVLIPPSILVHSDVPQEVPQEVQVIQDDVVSLECHAAGAPPPQFSWYRDGNPLQLTVRTHLLSDKSVLRISPVQVSDKGVYSCVAANKAGVAERKFHLHVHAPPTVGCTEPLEHLVVFRGSMVTLVCESHGSPLPTITWSKDNEPVYVQQNQQTHQDLLLDGGGGTRFQLLDIQLQDAGLYSCTAKNQAGTSTKTYNLTVLDPPKISDSRWKEELVVVVGGVLELECIAEGVPSPMLSWLKDGHPLEESRVTLHRDGGCLTIGNVQGEQLSYAMAPQIITLAVGEVCCFTAKAGLKADHEASIHTEPGFITKAHNIQSVTVQESDAGLYTCLASNPAGEDGQNHWVRVEFLPTVIGSSDVRTVSVPVKGHMTLECQTEGELAPEIQWYKDGIKLQVEGRVQTMAGGQYLEVGDVQVQDGGRYRCVISNMTGSTSLHFNIQIIAPPVIREGSSLVTAHVNQKVVLPCEVEGDSAPSVVWRKDGQLVQFHDDNRFVLLPEGSVRVESVQLQDAGHFYCSVSNQAGTDQRSIELRVYVPPSIHDDVISVTAAKMESAVLPCQATGRPAPAVTWSRNGAMLGPGLGSYSVLPTGELEISAVKPAHAGKYICSAQNTAGVAHKHVTLSVHETPDIRNMVEEVTVQLNQEVTLNCDAEGFPKPSVSWEREGVPIATGERVRVLSNGSLRIAQVFQGDTGTYTCIAQNHGGRAQGSTKLSLRVPPVVSVPRDKYTLVVGGSFTVTCTVIGQPEPELQWNKGGRPIRGGAIKGGAMKGGVSGTLDLKNVHLGQAGVYTCTATNSAGRASRDITLTIHVPPTILIGQSEVSVIQGFQALLSCEAQGFPDPRIHWERNGTVIQNQAEKFNVLRTGELIIERAQAADAGVFTCVAVNAAGSARHHLHLSVNMRPVFKEAPRDMTLRVGQNLTLTCHAHSNPPPTIKWTINNHPYTAHTIDESGRSFLMIKNVMVNDGGTFICTAENRVGSVRAVAFVRITEPPVVKGDVHVSQTGSQGGSVVLDCPVGGNPTPVLRWLKDGYPLQNGNHLQNGSVVLISVTSEDSGVYECVAENEGSVHRTIFLRVHVGFSDWEQWSPCSVTCGRGLQKRTRSCKSEGAECEGPNMERRQCQTSLCSGDPLRRARGSVTGTVNDIEFGDSVLEVNISENSDSRGSTIQAHIEKIPPNVGTLLQILIFVLAPVYWTAVYESAGTKNGFSISRGKFIQETQLQFESGEILKMTHTVRGLDADGVLLVDVVINGFIPATLSSLSSHLHLQDFDEWYVQVGSGQIYSWSTQNSLQQGVGSVMVRCNHSLVFDGPVKRIAPLLQKIHLSDIRSSYRAESFSLSIHMSAALTIPDGDGEKCPKGFLLSEASYCTDEDECAVDPPCSHSCINLMGGFSCSCPSGFSTESNSCFDIDECVEASHLCPYNQMCVNTIGSYRCQDKCGSGFKPRASGSGGCEDVDECLESSLSPCQHHCFNTLGSFHCGCRSGYKLVGHRCFDINECLSSVCATHQQCRNTDGGYQCLDSCPSGSTLAEGRDCVDIDECKNGSHLCLYSQTCQNTVGGYVCVCPRGYRSQGSGKPCVDVDECAQTLSPCGYQCRNIPGSFRCLCPAGSALLGDGRSCAGLERRKIFTNRTRVRLQPQLVSTRGLTPLTQLTNTQQGALWGNVHTCPLGYTSNGGTCEDVNECLLRRPCQHECRNLVGSFRCFCPSGYQLMPNGRTCRDIDECSEDDVECGPNQMCFNTRGAYQCLDTPCPASYLKGRSPGVCYKPCLRGCASGPSSLLLQYKLLTLPLGIPAQHNVVRLSAFLESGEFQERTTFSILEESGEMKQKLFGIKDEAGRGIIFASRPLDHPGLIKLRVQATTLNQQNQITYQSLFIIYISISTYPY